MKHDWIPPVSPYCLIQEHLWPDCWMILVVCMLLNQTSRKQVEKILPEFMKRWPDAAVFMNADENEVMTLIKPLGFSNRRTKNLFKMTERFIASNWDNVRELPGIGEYAARSYEIFCEGVLGSEPPKDHALLQYWNWIMSYTPSQK